MSARSMHQAMWCALLLTLPAFALHPETTAQSATPVADALKYQVPSPQIVATFDAPPLPQVIVSPTRQALAMTLRKGSPTLAELARPTLRLAGLRVNPENNGPHRTATNGGGYGITLKRIADGREIPVTVPPQVSVSNVHFSPDGSRLSFTNTRDAAIELWIADVATGQARKVSGVDRLNAVNGDPCDWMHDNVTMICQLVHRIAALYPVEPVVPAGPNVLENHDKAAPAPTYEDMIRTLHDEALFDYYVSSQLAAIDTTSGRRTAIGRLAVFETITPSPDDRFILVSRVKRPSRT